MSSHHFVKEGQEPALVIIDAVNHELAVQVLEWAPHVIVFEKEIDNILLWGIKMDVVITTAAHQQSLLDKLHTQAPLKLIFSEKTSLQTALDYLIATNQKATVIMVSDVMPLFQLLEGFHGKLSISLLTARIKWSAISSGFYKKWLSIGSILFLHGKSEIDLPPGLRQLNDHYEVTGNGIIELKSKNPFWVGESHG